jgi:uncharacterized cupredoxin-like copper-binding protein
MSKKFSRLIPLLLAGLLVSACAGPGTQAGGNQPDAAQQVTVQMTEFKFDPATLTVQQDRPVVVTLRNTGSVPHDFAVPELNVHSQNVAPGQTGRVEFTPSTSGTFRIVCTEPGHSEAGMVGQLVVP